MRRQLWSGVVAAGLLAAGCTAGDDAASTDTADPEVESEGAAPTAFPPDPRATGVTDDTIRLGVTYVDLEALADIVSLDHGDYEAAYQAVADDINADGGINGRRLELAFEPVVPIGTEPADATCVALTEDQEVFAVIGFMLDDAPLCYLELHDTPIIGGTITQPRLDRATAPWFATTPASESVTTRLIEAFDADGAFDGATVGVLAMAVDEQLMNDVTVPALEAQGIEVVDAAVADFPSGDTAAGLAQAAIIAERFETAGIDTVVTVANAALIAGQGFEPTSYRPRLLATGIDSLATYVQGEAGFDPELLQGALSGSYAGASVQYQDPEMQECAGVVEEATGEVLPDPATVEPGSGEPWVSVFAACMQLSLFRQIAEAAGEDLNNGTFGAAGYSLGEINLPGDGGSATYGPDTLDGARPIYLIRFDEAEGRLVGDTEPTSG